MADVETKHQESFFLTFLKQISLFIVNRSHHTLKEFIVTFKMKRDRLGNMYVWYGSDDCIGFAIILACCQQQYTTDTSSNLREHLYVL